VPDRYGVFDAHRGSAVDAHGDGRALIADGRAVVAVHDATSSVEK
jgi:hypothetical protein